MMRLILPTKVPALLFAVFAAIAVSAETNAPGAVVGYEVSPAVDGPFRAQFKNATLLEVNRKESTNWVGVITSLGGTIVTYELTLSDALNKKFKAVFDNSGRVLHTDKYLVPFDRLPADVQAAVENQVKVTDRGTTVQNKIEYMKGAIGFHVSGKINGTDINVKVPIVPPIIAPEAIIMWNHKPVDVFPPSGKISAKNTVILTSMSTPYSSKFSYAWSQSGGEDLHLAPADLVKDHLSFQIQKAGNYSFRLSVSDGQTTSAPAKVDVEAVDLK